ncbi:MAG: chorismate mutase [Neisseria sp.]|nr:chorismate mutase [Neisseria sp.]
MLIVMEKQASAAAVDVVVNLIREHGLREHISRGSEVTIIGAVGDERVLNPQKIMALPQVARAIRVLHDWKIISREMQNENSVISVRGVPFGGEQVLHIASQISELNQANALYADPFFVSNNPYEQASQAQEKAQLKAMREAIATAHDANKPVLLRVRDVRQIQEALAAGADILYLGGELMSNRTLLQEVGRLNTPVVLCKDKHHRYQDWLLAAEHIALQGNHQIILGEAGTLSFEPDHIHRLDIEAMVRVRRLSHLPVLANISQLWHNEMPSAVLKNLAIAAGASGVIL